MKTFIKITDPRFIPLILLDEVEGVLWKNTPGGKLREVLRHFNDASFKALLTDERLRNDPEKHGTDPGRILITAEEERQFTELGPLWKERMTLSQTLNSALKTDQIRTMGLMVIPQTDNAAERGFHRDWATGDNIAEELFITVSHTHAGSEAIPACDAGDSENRADPVAARQFFPGVQSLENLLKSDIHDVLIFKTGKNGAVHRAPKIESGALRWLSFYFADAKGLKSIRENFTPKELNRLGTLELKQ